MISALVDLVRNIRSAVERMVKINFIVPFCFIVLITLCIVGFIGSVSQGNRTYSGTSKFCTIESLQNFQSNYLDLVKHYKGKLNNFTITSISCYEVRYSATFKPPIFFSIGKQEVSDKAVVPQIAVILLLYVAVITTIGSFFWLRRKKSNKIDEA